MSYIYFDSCNQIKEEIVSMGLPKISDLCFDTLLPCDLFIMNLEMVNLNILILMLRVGKVLEQI